MQSTWIRLFLTWIVLAALCACSSTAEKPKPPELPQLAASSEAPLTRVWNQQIGAILSPLNMWTRDGQVAVASSAGTFALLDAATGRDLWRLSLNTGLQAGVGGDGNRFAVVSQNNEVIAMQSGQVIWRYRLSATTYTAPLVAGGRVFVLTSDRTVLALDGASGQRLWSQQRSGDPLVLRQAGLLMAVGDTLVAGLSGRLVGFNPNNGALRWESVVGASRGTNEVERLVDVVAGVSRQASLVCARSFQTAVSCVDAAKGQTLWSRSASGHQGLDGNSQNVIGVESDSKIVSWSRSSGQVAWSSEALRFRGLTSPVVVGDSILVGDESGLLHRLAMRNGESQNRTNTDSSGISNIVLAAPNLVVVTTRSGSVFGYRLD